jgi:hypothetical protein
VSTPEERARERAESRAFYEGIADPEMRDDMLHALDVEERAERGEPYQENGMATSPEGGVPMWAACLFIIAAVVIIVALFSGCGVEDAEAPQSTTTVENLSPSAQETEAYEDRIQRACPEGIQEIAVTQSAQTVILVCNEGNVEFVQR